MVPLMPPLCAEPPIFLIIPFETMNLFYRDDKIKKLEDALLLVKKANIFRSSVKQAVDPIPDAEIVE
jgi:hypothetical protein